MPKWKRKATCTVCLKSLGADAPGCRWCDECKAMWHFLLSLHVPVGKDWWKGPAPETPAWVEERIEKYRPAALARQPIPYERAS